MATVPPRDAVAYALDREMLALYGVVLAGYVGLLAGAWLGVNWAVRGGGARGLGRALSVLLLVAGFAAIAAGLVGLVYEVIADANATARA